MNTVQFKIEGMHCASCVSHVEKSIETLAEVETVSVNLAMEKATVGFNEIQLSKQAMIQAVQKAVKTAGYRANLITGLGSTQDTQDGNQSVAKAAEQRRSVLLIMVSAGLTAPLVLAMLLPIVLAPLSEMLAFLHRFEVQFALATPVQFFIGWRFYRMGFKTLIARNLGMDFLVMLGTSAAYCLSVFNGIQNIGGGEQQPIALYFESSAVIITLVLLGKHLEANARARTSTAIKKLMSLQPDRAIIEQDGLEQKQIEVAVADIAIGDIVVIKPGSRIPVDGKIISGKSAIDESTITGESIPVEKSPGDKLVSGSINSYGLLRYQATHLGKDSMLARMIAIVEEAQASKAPIQQIADKVVAVFVPIVLAIASLSFFIWWLLLGNPTEGLLAAVAVLAIACPCAVGLATPTAIIVGTGLGAQHGILIRSSQTLELAEKIQTVILDKTGTITEGKPKVSSIKGLTNSNDGPNYWSINEKKDNSAKPNEVPNKLSSKLRSLLCLAASLENGSEHPLAKAVTTFAKEQNIELYPVQQLRCYPGEGVEGYIEHEGHNLHYAIGNQRMMQRLTVDLQSIEQHKILLESQGQTVVMLASGKQILGLIAIADQIKDSSAAGVQRLKDMQLKVQMISGDNLCSARAIAAKAGLEDVLAEVPPQDKAAAVKSLQQQGQCVAMVGDGVNDAPALALADVGIAMGQGTDVAMEAGDITLMHGNLSDIAIVIQLSHKTMNKVRQNLFWAFFFNSIGIPFAAFGLLNPMIAGAAMAFSSVAVVSNSLALRRFVI